jgi:septal ring factor EnvC (AmiA/AmiB activator)
MKKKQDNFQQLQNSREILEKVIITRTASLNQINLIQKSIELRQEIIDNISKEIELLGSDIDLNNIEILNIGNRMETLKEEYAKLIKNSYKMLDNEYALMYILSAVDINQGYMRVKYLKYLTDYRRNLISELDSQKIYLLKLNKSITENKIKNEKLLNERKKEMRNLGEDKKKKVILVGNLKAKETELRKEIRNREKIMIQIEAEIKKLIEEEERKARNVGRKNILSEADRILASEFNKNQGKLPWPIEKGIITRTFGKQKHPVLKDIEYTNKGIDISTIPGTKVNAVFNGQVSVIAIIGSNYTVIIRHGNFYTVYQNLGEVRVKRGDNVKTGEYLGIVFTGQDNISKIHFEIWKEKGILDPEVWLRK